MAPAALIIVGAILIVLAVLAGASDIVKLALFGLGVLSMAIAGVLEIAGRRVPR